MIAVSAALAGEVTVWCWDPELQRRDDAGSRRRYKADHPDFSINVVDFAKADVEQKLQAQLASGTTEGLPDIVLIEDYGIQKYLQSFPGAFEPLGGAIDMSKFAKYKVDAATLNGQSYSLPFDSGVTGFFYRTDYLKDAGYSEADLQDLTWDDLIKIGKDVEAKTGHKLLSLDINDAGPIRIMMQSAGSWYFTPDGAGEHRRQSDLQGGARRLRQGAAVRHLPAGFRLDRLHRRLHLRRGRQAPSPACGSTGTIKANPDQPASGAWRPIPKLAGVEGATHASNLGGSSWFVLSPRRTRPKPSTSSRPIWANDVDFYQKILVNQGAFGTLLEARDGPAFQASDPFFSGQPVWQNFTNWLAEIPGVNYGIFTNEADAAVAAQLPALKDGADIDEAIKQIDAQVKQQTM